MTEKAQTGTEGTAAKKGRSRTRFASRDEVIASVLPVFRKYGLDGATLSVLSEEIGLQRSSLYHHFPEGKEQMAAACLEQAGAQFKAQVFDVLASNEDPQVRIRKVTETLRRYYEDGRLGCLLAAFALENSRARFGPQLDRGLRDWIAAAAKLFRDQGQGEGAALEAAEEVVSAIQGGLIVSLCLGSNRAFLRAVGQLDRFSDR